jgi:hypothetical protein
VFLLSGSLLTPPVLAQEQDSDSQSTATCSFENGQEISVRYNSVPYGKNNSELPSGKVWMPGGSPMFLFAQATLASGNIVIQPGAYSLYVIPGKKEWILIVNKDVTTGARYDEKQDLLRARMEMGSLSEASEFKVSFAHMAPRLCNMRLYYGKVGAWVDFTQR